MVCFVTRVVLMSCFMSSCIWALELSVTKKDDQSSLHAVSPDQDEKLFLDLQLREALKTGSVEDVRRLLAQGASPDHQSSLRVAPLFYAAYYGHVECAKALLDHGADGDATYALWLTPHQIAFLEGHTEVAQLFAAHGLVLKNVDRRWSPLHRAAFFGDDKRILFLVSQGFSTNDLTSRGESPLHLAARGGSISCVNHLLTMKANLMARQLDGSTALHCACEGGLLPFMGLCLEKGFNLHKPDNRGWQPIHCASRYGSCEAVSLLLINGADANAKTLDGLRPVHLAAIHADLRSLQALAEHDAQLCVTSRRGRTPLHYAVLSNSVGCAQFCLRNGVDPEAQDNQGWRALDIAADRGSLEVLITLLKHGISLKRTQSSLMGGLFKGQKELSPLLLAVDCGHAECVGALLDAGAASFSDNDREYTPLDAALTYGSREVVEAFIERIYRFHHSSVRGTKVSYKRIAEFFDVMNEFRIRYNSLNKMNTKLQLKIITSLDETEEDFARTIVARLIQSECLPNLGSENARNSFESITEDDSTHLLSQDVTREAVNRYYYKVVRRLFKRFHRKNDMLHRLNDPQYKFLSQERRTLLDPMKVEENFGSTIRRGINEWMTFLEDPIKETKGHMRTRYGYTPLHFAAMRSSADIVRSLLEQGLSARVRTDTDDGVTPLHLAALGGKLENMDLIHKAGIPITATTKQGTTVLQYAAYGGSVDCVKYCLTKGCKVDERNSSGVRPLHYAAFGGSEAVIKFLHAQGALMNEPSDMVSQWLRPPKFSSPLMLATKGGFAGCVKALLDGGSDPRQVEYVKGTEIPLVCALEYGSEEILRVFINSCYRCFYPTHSQIEEARRKMYDWFQHCQEQGSTLNFGLVMTLLNDTDLVTYFVRALLSELNTEEHSSSPAFNDLSSSEFQKLCEAPVVLDVVTKYLMTDFKALCKKLCDINDRNKNMAPDECMTAKRRALLDPGTFDKTFRPTVRTVLKERFSTCTRELRETDNKESSDKGAIGTKRQQLLEAVKNGFEHDVERLLHEGVSPDEMVAGHIRALPYAVYYGHKECAQMLMRAGAAWEAPFLYDFTPHKLAVLNNKVELAELFSARGSSVEPTDCSDWHALHWASLFGDIEGLRTLISQGAHIDCRTDEGLTPLHLAALGGSRTCVDYLIKQGADMMARQNDGLTLLHCAVEGDLTSLVDLCIKKGLPISVMSHEKRWQPIHTAARYGSPNMISHLLSREADVHARTGAGMSPLHLAAASGNINNMSKLVEWGGNDLSALSKNNRSILHLAAVGGSVECVYYCLFHGLTHEQRDSKGWRALHYAAQIGSPDVLKLLLTKEVPHTTSFELSLRLAIGGGHAECIKLLLDAGGNPMSGALNTETPFEYAIKYGSLSVIKTLMHNSYKLLCPTELEVGTSRVHIAKALDKLSCQPTYQKEPTIMRKMSILMQSDITDDIARSVLGFLNTDTDVSCIAGLSEEETNCFLQLDDAKDIVEYYLVEQLSTLCKNIFTAQVESKNDDTSKDENLQKIDPHRQELFTQESLQKIFGHHIRQGLDEQFARVVSAEHKEASQSSGSNAIVPNLECRIF